MIFSKASYLSHEWTVPSRSSPARALLLSNLHVSKFSAHRSSFPDGVGKHPGNVVLAFRATSFETSYVARTRRKRRPLCPVEPFVYGTQCTLIIALMTGKLIRTRLHSLAQA